MIAVAALGAFGGELVVEPGGLTPHAALAPDDGHLVTDAEEFAALRDKAILEFLYACGARISEASNLRMLDIDFASHDDDRDFINLSVFLSFFEDMEAI